MAQPCHLWRSLFDSGPLQTHARRRRDRTYQAAALSVAHPNHRLREVIADWSCPHAEAILAYRQAVALKPAGPDLLVDLGTSFFYIGRNGQALSHIDQALAEAPRHLNGLINRGIVLNHLGAKPRPRPPGKPPCRPL